MTIEALFELKRLTILAQFSQSPKSIDPAYAYAMEHRLAPIYHEALMREAYGHDPFEQAYRISAAKVSAISTELDDLWRAKDYESMSFYAFEERHEGQLDRVELIRIFEYFRISGRFDRKCFEAIEADAPSEACTLDDEYSADEVDFE